MIRLLYSGKFWLKALLFGLLLPFLLWLGAYFGLRHLLSEPRIQQTANAVLAGNGQQFTFDGRQIERGWLPYPYVVLHRVGLNHPQDGQALSAETVRLSFSWSALWGEKSIHSLHLNRATLSVRRLGDGQWTVAGLPADSTTHAFLPRRIELNDSVLRIQYGEQKRTLFQVAGFVDRINENFNLAASLFAPQEFRLQVSGNYEAAHFKQLQVQLSGFLYGGQTFTAGWQGNADYSAEQSQLNTQEGRINLQIPDWRLNLEGNTRNWQLSPTGITLPETHIVFTTGAENGKPTDSALRHNGNGSINKAFYHNKTLDIGGIQIGGTIEHGNASSSYSANGRLKMQVGGRFQADNLYLNTRHTAGGGMPSWVGQWSGRAEGSSDAWQAELQGSLDNNEGYLKFSGTRSEQNYSIDASVRLSKLSLTDYLTDNTPASDASVAEPLWLKYWPQALHNRRITLSMDIGILESAGLQIQNFHSVLRIDTEKLQAETIRMQMYDGHAVGHAVLHRNERPGWETVLVFNGIQIKPLLQDAFRFHHLSGKGNASFRFAATGLNRAEWRTTLAGHGKILLDNGSWQGINLGKLLDNPDKLPAQSLISYNADSNTPFRHFSIEADVKDGIGTTPRLSLQSDSLNLSGQGSFDINNNTLNYAVLASAGNGLWLPLKIGGNIGRPSFALDYQRITGNLQTAEQKQRALQEVLEQQWQWIQKLPENSQP